MTYSIAKARFSMKILLKLYISRTLIPISIMQTFHGQVRMQKHAVCIVFSKDKLIHSKPLLKNLNALNVYQINIPTLKRGA